MASSWIATRKTKTGATRFLVYFQPGGRAAKHRYGGSFPTRRLALARQKWIDNELSQLRMPDIRALERQPARPSGPTVAELSMAWQAAHVDVSTGTAQTYRIALGRLLPRLGDTPAAELEAHHVAALVATLAADGLRKQTIRKTVSVLAMILDHHGIQPNPARDARVKLPREEKQELSPPTASTCSRCTCSCHPLTGCRF